MHLKHKVSMKRLNCSMVTWLFSRYKLIDLCASQCTLLHWYCACTSTMMQNLRLESETEKHPSVRDCNHGIGSAEGGFVLFHHTNSLIKLPLEWLNCLLGRVEFKVTIFLQSNTAITALLPNRGPKSYQWWRRNATPCKRILCWSGCCAMHWRGCSTMWQMITLSIPWTTSTCWNSTT